MSDSCKDSCASTSNATSPLGNYRKILWIALLINASMFLIEIIFGKVSGSVSLLADAIDFFGDALNYALSLFVLGASLLWRSRLALGKGFVMLAYGLFIFAQAFFNIYRGISPEPFLMGGIGLLALVANLSVAWMLYAYREGDANMQSVWLCTRNDVLGNIAIVFAAVGVFGTATFWPDVIVAFIMGALGISSGWRVIQRANEEIKTGVVKTSHDEHGH